MRPRCAGVHILPLNHTQNLLKTYHSEFPKGLSELQRVRPGAILVNTARGGVVDEVALAEALSTGRIAAAGLDVFDPEPPSIHNPLLKMEQVILTPHIAGLTTQAAERMAVYSVKNVLDFFAGVLDPALVVNREFVK